MIVDMGKRVHVQEVATRDGFQIEPTFIPTEAKIALIDALGKTGLPVIEATSFTSPKAIPALRDAEDVMRGIARPPSGAGLARRGAGESRGACLGRERALD